MIGSKLKKASAVIISLALIMMIAAVSVFSAGAAEPEKGSIEVELKEEFAGLPLALVTIGDYKNGELELYDDFKSVDLKSSDFDNNKVLKEKLFQIRDLVRANDIDSVVEMIGYDGNANFRDLDTDKAYVVMQPFNTPAVSLSPSLVFIPAWVDGVLMRDIHITAKAENPASVDNRGAVIVNKKDDKDVPLEGAEFSLWRKNYYTDTINLPVESDDFVFGEDSNGKYYWEKYKDFSLVTNENGQCYVDQLRLGYNYRVIEEKAPEGFILDQEPHEFFVDGKCEVTVENEMYVFKNGQGAMLDILNMPVQNTSKTESSDESQDSKTSKTSKVTSEPSDKITPSYPTPSKTEVVTSSGDGNVVVEITGDDIVKYIVIPAVLVASLILIVLLIVAGGKKNKNKDK